jgi:PAS domain S-box-containing protein
MASGMEKTLTPASLETAAEIILEGMSAEEMEPKDLSRSWTEELEVYCKDGSTIWTEMEATFLRDPDSQVVGILGVARNITERKLAEEALRESEEKIRNIFDSVADGIFAIELNGCYIEVNDRLREIHGFSSKDELLGKNAFELVAQRDMERAIGDMQRTLAQGSVGHLAYTALKADGSEFPAEVSGTLIEDASGNPVGIIGSIRDITERKQAEEALRNSELHFRGLIENALDGIAIINPDLTIRYQSPSMERMTGRKAEDRIGKDPLEFCHPDDVLEVGEAFLPLFENRIHTVHTEFRYRHKSGRWRTFEVVGTNLIDNPAVAGIILNMRDITERKRAEDKVRRLMEGLEQRVAERTRQLQVVNLELESFAYSVSHDLRAPLRSIDGFSQVLLDDYTNKLDDEGKDYLQRVRSASQRMAALIDDLLNLSRVTRGEMRYETVDLSALAQTITMELQQSQPERDVEFTIAPGLVAKGDGQLLRVVLENLLYNAWKFARMRAPARIEFGYAETNGQPAYFVRDNGVGFDMAYADKLFGAFQRMHSVEEFEGTGIGLATVQRIINRHGGNIWAESAVGQGATFYFTLKL